MNVKKFSNIAIIRDDRLGDTILTLPVVKKLKNEFPKSRLTIVISQISKDLIQIIDFVDDYIISENTIRTIKEINSKKFDLIINFSPLKRKTYKFFLKAKWKINVTYSSRYSQNLSHYRYKVFLLNIFFNRNYLHIRNNFKNLKHHTIYMNEVLHYEGLYSSNKPEKINLNLKNELKYDYLIHLSNRWINYEYLEYDLISLIEEISKRANKISFSTDLEISNDIQKVCELIKLNNNHSLILKPKFQDWISLINKSQLVITPECGCSHVCGLLNKRAIIIYNKKNKVNFIKKEYHPYLAKGIVQLSSDAGKQLNKKILSYA